ncbi:hypothetical protein ACWC4E_16480 [Streptomyces sp. NPDC001273]|uniref:hypothetical protein n=1 Tax=unclassified Streptomyces TaxID=2593676 RepID=UPI0034008BA8
MTAHDEARDPAREGSGTGDEGFGPEYDGPEYDGPEYDGPEYDGPEYDGMDALMAALLDEPLPEQARRDPAFVAARDAAAADLAVLREQLTVIGDALAGPGDGAPAEREAAARPGKRPDTDAGPGQDVGTRSPGGTAHDPEAAPSPVTPAPLTDPPSRSGGGDRGGAAAAAPSSRRPGAGPRTAGGPRGPHRPRRRTAKVVLGGLVAAGAAGLVLGMGWLVTQGEGVTGAADGSVAADSKEAGGVLFGSPRYLACARLVAEGSVTEVEQVPGATGTERVTLEVSRYYKGGGEVTFLRYTADGSPLRAGDRVLVGMPLDGVHPDMVVVGEPDIARERALITASLPESRTLTCD